MATPLAGPSVPSERNPGPFARSLAVVVGIDAYDHGYAGDVRLWRVATAKPYVLAGHNDSIGSETAPVFSPDGKRLVTGGQDARILLWSLDTEDPTANPLVLVGHTKKILDLAFSPDGRLLASTDGVTVRLWPMRQADQVRLACRSAGRSFTDDEARQFLLGDARHERCAGTTSADTVRQLLAMPDSITDRHRPLDTKQVVAIFRAIYAIVETLDEPEPARDACARGIAMAARLGPEGHFSAGHSAGEAARSLLPICERAVALDPDDGPTYDRLGVARGFTLDYEGAADALTRYVEWTRQHGLYESQGQRREAWIAKLRQRSTPFIDDDLKVVVPE